MNCIERGKKCIPGKKKHSAGRNIKSGKFQRKTARAEKAKGGCSEEGQAGPLGLVLFYLYS